MIDSLTAALLEFFTKHCRGQYNSVGQFTTLITTCQLKVQFLKYFLDVPASPASVSRDVKCISLNETEMKEVCPQGQRLQIIGIFYFDSINICR